MIATIANRFSFYYRKTGTGIFRCLLENIRNRELTGFADQFFFLQFFSKLFLHFI